MIDVRNIKLKNEIPENILRDNKVLALAKSLDKSLEAPMRMIDAINYEMNLQNLSEETIDHLLWENNVKQLEGLMFVRNKTEKINLLKSIKDLKRTKGTPYAIERVLEVMGMKGYVEEWFQYDSLPFHFLVELEIANDFREIEDVRKMVMHYKNKRSWFDGFVVLMAPGGFILWDDSYSYPVFYKDCGWFTGIKYYTEFNFKTIELLEKTYDYEVSYPLSEKEILYTNIKPMVITNDSYSYIKELPYANEMELLLKKVDTQTSALDCKNENYEYPVSYEANTKELITIDSESTKITESSYGYHKIFPVASEMEPMIKITATQEDKLSCKDKSYSFEQTYPVCGEFYAES